jgi:hypothetical protein
MLSTFWQIRSVSGLFWSTKRADFSSPVSRSKDGNFLKTLELRVDLRWFHFTGKAFAPLRDELDQSRQGDFSQEEKPPSDQRRQGNGLKYI